MKFIASLFESFIHEFLIVLVEIKNVLLFIFVIAFVILLLEFRGDRYFFIFVLIAYFDSLITKGKKIF